MAIFTFDEMMESQPLRDIPKKLAEHARAICVRCGAATSNARYCPLCNTIFTTAANDTATPRGWGTNYGAIPI